VEIKLKKPRTCSHCPAYADSYCSLGYKVKRVPLSEAKIWRHFTTWEDAVIRIKPDEPCPKPKNINECVEIRKIVDVHRYSNPNSPEYKAEEYEMMTKEESHIAYIRNNKDE
jgi:hypothetical protein